MARTPEQVRAWARAYRQKNREKIRAYARKWYREHPERQREWAKRKFARNPDKHRMHVRRNYLDRAYGDGAADYYDAQLAKQEGRCAICGKPSINRKFGKLHLDHDTSCCRYEYTRAGKRKMLRSCGRCRRGLLCNTCNGLLPGVEDQKWARKAMAYIMHWRREHLVPKSLR